MKFPYTMYFGFLYLLFLSEIHGVHAQESFYQAKSGIIRKGNNIRAVLSNARVGDYEFVLSGASANGMSVGKDEYLDAPLMESQGFKPLGVIGNADRRAEAWGRVSDRFGGLIRISGKANGVAYTIVTMRKSKITLDIDAFTRSRDFGGHGNRRSVRLRTPRERGVKLVSFFFDDPVELRGQGNGVVLFADRGFGDGDGYAAILYEEGVTPPSSLSITNHDDRGDDAPGEYASVVVNIPVVSGNETPQSPSSNDQATLGANEVLFLNEKIETPSRNYRLRFQSDGNLVLRDRSGRALWATGTNGTGGFGLFMQGDGNLVIYNRIGRTLWSSRTGQSGATKLVLTGDGRLRLEMSNGSIVKTLYQ